jgi:hypothetical protein
MAFFGSGDKQKLSPHKCIKKMYKNHNFLSQHLKHHCSDYNEDSILYKFEVSSVHNMKAKALSKETCTRDVCMAWPFLVPAICSFSIV